MDPGYPVVCDCGYTHRVSEGSAGALLDCGCGRQVRVPSLRALRRAAGEPVATPEMEIRALLLDGDLPEEPDCLCCGMPTDDVCHAGVVCERSEVVGDTDWKLNLLPLLFGRLVFTRSRQTQDRGHDISFRLPLRICRECVQGLNRRTLVEAMRRVPVYDRLLQSYPHAEITLERR